MTALHIIDFHTHVYPDAIAHKAAKSIRDFYQIGDVELDGTTKLLLEKGDAAGIDRFVILPVALKPDHVGSINDFIKRQADAQPRFTAFGTLHAAMDHMEAEVERMDALGLKGVKMHPDSQVFPIDDPRLFPAYDMLQGKKPILFHMGDNRYNYSHPTRLRRVLDLFPRLQVIAAHFGGYSMQDIACDNLRDTDCFFDISSSIMFMEEGEPEKYVRLYGAQRMLFGSDFPLWDPVIEVERFKQLKLTGEEFDQISHKTALTILGE